jgi:UDP-N-acetylglucosamine:LPS N-acetylglucosamine transferase
MYDHVDDEILKSLLLSASLIICRSGYSTLMDLSALGCKALLVPTPGQTEQEYLAEINAGKNYESIEQKNLNAGAIITLRPVAVMR